MSVHHLEAHLFLLREALSLTAVTCVCQGLTFVPLLWYMRKSLKTAFAESLHVAYQVIILMMVAHFVAHVFVYVGLMLYNGPVVFWQRAVTCGDLCPEFYAYFVPIVMRFSKYASAVAITWIPVKKFVVE